jgi:hypothetical protein
MPSVTVAAAATGNAQISSKDMMTSDQTGLLSETRVMNNSVELASR